MRNRIAVLVAAIVAVALLAVPATDAKKPNVHIGPRATCGKLHTITEVRALARRAWSRAWGPTKAQKRNYRRDLRCPLKGTRGRMKVEWHAAQKKYEHLRYMKRLRGRCGVDNVEACVVYAALAYEQDVAKAIDVAESESGMTACPSGNPTHFGVFQFDEATWAGTPYSAHSPCEPLWASLGAMWYWARGETSRWTTY